MALAGIALLTGCGHAAIQPESTSSPHASTAPLVASPTPQSSSVQAQTLFAVLESHSPQGKAVGPDTIAIAGRDGYARAKAHFPPLTLPYTGCGAPVLPIQAYVAAGHAFYLDGRGVVRSLSPSGAISVVATFPITSSQQEATFAVSPDGQHLMGTVWTFPPRPSPAPACPQGPEFGSGAIFQQDVYAAAAGQLAQHLQHESWPQVTTLPPPRYPFLEFIGWDSVGPIGAVNAIYEKQGGGGGPWKWNGDPVRVLASGKPGAPLLGSVCEATDVETNGFVCVSGQMGTVQSEIVTIHDPNGSELWRFQRSDISGYAVLSPGRQRVALLTEAVSNGGGDVPLPQSADGAITFVVTGWLDDATLIGWIGTADEMAMLQAAKGAQPEDLGFRGSFVGAL